jgi:hypothetical protein
MSNEIDEKNEWKDGYNEFSFKEPKFKKGNFYLVKANDHFTRQNNNVEELFINFVGIYTGDSKNDKYYKFISLFYEDYDHKPEFYANEVRFVLKGSLETVKPLGIMVHKKISEIDLSNKKGESEIKILESEFSR